MQNLNPKWNEIFDYRDGALYWKVQMSNRAPIGTRAGTVRKDGRRATSVYGNPQLVSRIIFAMHNHGAMPRFIDHIDGDPANDNIDNLRAASRAQNGWNVPAKKTNTSGAKNVSWRKDKSKWEVQLRVAGKRLHYGLFTDFDLAELVAIEARNKHHGIFARHE